MGKPIRLFAAIDIGSQRLRMKIVEIGREGRLRELENVDLLIPLGRDTFNDGKLSFASVRATCEAIAGFQRLMTDYGVTECRVVATSALREASNREYMVDQIRMLTGFDVEIINNAQEKFLTFQAARSLLQGAGLAGMGESVLVLDIGAGSIQLSRCTDGHLVSSQSMKIGALRIKEAMGRIEQHSLRFSDVLEEYIEAHVESLDTFRDSDDPTRFVVITGESETLVKLAGVAQPEPMTAVSRDRFEKSFHKAVEMPAPQLAALCGISQAGADVIAPVLILIRKFFDKTAASEVLFPHITLVDGLIAEHVQAGLSRAGSSRFEADVLSNAEHLAQRYRYNRTHSQYVVSASLLLFDSLRTLHGMDARDRFLLHVAALLHDTGKFIAADPHAKHSDSLIRASQLAGLSDMELLTVASIARYHSSEEPSFDSDNLRRLGVRNRLKTVKMIAIIRLADALDTSHRQKITGLRVELAENACRIRGSSRMDTALEQWTFGMKSEFFREVFGLKPLLTIANKAGKPEEAP